MKLLLQSFALGVVITTLLTVAAFVVNTRVASCVFAWQACLVQTVIHTADNPIHEASPIDLFAFAFGVLLGVPIYSLLAYVLLARSRRRSAQSEPHKFSTNF